MYILLVAYIAMHRLINSGTADIILRSEPRSLWYSVIDHVGTQRVANTRSLCLSRVCNESAGRVVKLRDGQAGRGCGGQESEVGYHRYLTLVVVGTMKNCRCCLLFVWSSRCP